MREEGLRDEHPYARKAACLGCLRNMSVVLLFFFFFFFVEDDVNTFNDSGILETVEKLLEDRDANVVANALVTIVEIFGESDARLQKCSFTHRFDKQNPRFWQGLSTFGLEADL